MTLTPPTDVRKALALVQAVNAAHGLTGLLAEKAGSTRRQARATLTQGIGPDPVGTILPLQTAVGAPRAEIEQAAAVVFRAGQRELAEHVGFKPRTAAERTALVAIWRRLDQARRAAELSSGARKPGRAKRLQLEATGGAPLTICVGTIRFPDQLNGDGCGAVFFDVSHARGAIFSRYCGECRDTRQPRRERKRAEKVREREAPRSALGWHHDGRRWFHIRCACSSYFFTTDPRRICCDRCHENKRTPPAG